MGAERASERASLPARPPDIPRSLRRPNDAAPSLLGPAEVHRTALSEAHKQRSGARSRGSAAKPERSLPSVGEPIVAIPKQGRERSWYLADAARGLLAAQGIRNAITACGLAVRRGSDDGQAHPIFRRERNRQGQEVIAVDNVAWCGSARCPRCGPLVAERLQERVSTVLVAVAERNFGAALMTLTVSRNARTPLAEVSRATGDVYTAMQRVRAYSRERDAGLIGLCPVWEVTAGKRTGWHPHVHVLVIHRDGIEAAVAAGKRLVLIWQSLLRKRGWHTADAAQDVRPITTLAGLDGYGTKGMTGWGAAAELAAGWHKEGRRPDRLTIPQLLGLADQGDRWAAEQYVEAVTALSGKRLFVVGPRVAAALGIASVVVEDGDAVEPEKRPGLVLGIIPSQVWNCAAKRRQRAWVVMQVRYLTDAGVCWEDVSALVAAHVMRPTDQPRGPPGRRS